MSTWSQYKTPNLGLLFYRHIYQQSSIVSRVFKNEKGELTFKIGDKETSPFDSFYEDLYEEKISDYEQIVNPLVEEDERFTLVTTYPGLLVGSGYSHDTKARGDFKIGFFFDHTSGQPIIPGSSVKGVLRSVFELDFDSKGKDFTGEISTEFINWLLNSLEGSDTQFSLNTNEVSKIKDEIFGNQDKQGNDVFFDAVINISETISQQFIGNDFITPHEDPLKNPNPIQFLKIKPGVAFEFRFKFTDKGFDTGLKLRLFEKIILKIGAGAKTNVGYGQFTTLDKYKELYSGKPTSNVEEEATTNKIPVMDLKNVPTKVWTKLEKNSEWPGEIIGQRDGYNVVQFEIDGINCVLVKNSEKNPNVRIGQSIKIFFNNPYDDKNPNFKIKE